MRNLQEFISKLEEAGELLRVKEFVSVDLEMAEINDRFVKSGGKAILFENNETRFPVLLNMFGSEKRISTALRVEKLEDLTDRIDNIFSKATSPQKSLMDKLRMLPMLKDMSDWMPKNISGKGECQQIIITGNDINLYDLPIIKSAPHDASSFVTLPLVCSIDPQNGTRNMGMYRMQVVSKNSTGMHWHKHKTGERHYTKYREMGIRRMPIAVCLGGDPSYTYCATAPLPEGIDEYIMAGFIRKKAVKLVKCITNDLRVPYDCDFVIEGYVDTTENKFMEGPFGDHTGFYSLPDLYPTFHITAITHRHDAVYPATVVGIPPQEDAYIGMATERIFLSPIKAVMQPEIIDMHLPFEGVAHNIAMFDIDKRYAGQGLKVASAMWGAGQMMFNKFAIITSLADGYLSNINRLKGPLAAMNIEQSIIISKGPLDVLDHNAPICGFGGKMCVDLTHRVEGESQQTAKNILLPKQLSLPNNVIEINTYLAQQGWSIITIRAERHGVDFRDIVPSIISKNHIEGINLYIVFDKEINLNDIQMMCWIAGNNIDPIRDAMITEDEIVLDARSKIGGLNGVSRAWPNIITQNQDVIDRIDSKWEALALGKFIPSPSLRYLRLKFSDNAQVDKDSI